MFNINLMCHCGNNVAFTACCSPFLKSVTTPSNAEQLMRSRFTAFKLRNHQYILDTQRLNNQPPVTIDSFDPSIEWLGLYVLSHRTQPNSPKQQVEFVAFFNDQRTHQLGQLHELSDFEYQQNQWFYTAAQTLPSYKIPRNILCFCLSGKKYKKCHALTSF